MRRMFPSCHMRPEGHLRGNCRQLELGGPLGCRAAASIADTVGGRVLSAVSGCLSRAQTLPKGKPQQPTRPRRSLPETQQIDATQSARLCVSRPFTRRRPTPFPTKINMRDKPITPQQSKGSCANSLLQRNRSHAVHQATSDTSSGEALQVSLAAVQPESPVKHPRGKMGLSSPQKHLPSCLRKRRRRGARWLSRKTMGRGLCAAQTETQQHRGTEGLLAEGTSAWRYVALGSIRWRRILRKDLMQWQGLSLRRGS